MTKHCQVLLACAALAAAASITHAHGYVGNRFFPGTVTTEDPLVADELVVPSLMLFDTPWADASPEARAIIGSFEFNKVIVPKLALGVSDAYLWQNPRNGPATRGWDNLALSLKYEVWRDVPHEAIVSVGLEAEIGGTGSRSIGRDSFTTFVPTLYFGKGFGDLPDALNALKPIAVTGTVGLTLPTESEGANAIEWGLALQYNLPYLQQHVADIGLPEPFRNMIPLVEFAFSTDLNRAERGSTTGTVNPGVLWEFRYAQLGIEALIPINSASGSHVGAMLQMQIYIDDLFPKLFGQPIFGE